MEVSPAGWAALGFSALMIGVSKAGFGSGVGIVAAPLTAVAIGSMDMLGVLLPALMVGDVFSVVHYLKTRDARNLAMLLGGSAVGVAAGTVLLGWFRGLDGGAEALDGAVGAICVVFVAMQTARLLRARGGPGTADAAASPDPVGPPSEGEGPSAAAPAAYRPRIWHGVATGAVAGLTSTLSHAAGPVVAMFLLPQRLGPRVFVGTCAWFFLVTNLMKVPAYSMSTEPVVTSGTLSTLPVMAPVVVAGTLLGVWMNRRLPARVFTTAIYAVVLATGVKLLAGLCG